MRSVLFLFMLLCVAPQTAQAEGGHSYQLRCELRLNGRVLEKAEIALGAQGAAAEITLYDSENHAVFAYVDVEPLGYERGYKSRLSLRLGEMPEDSGRGVVSYEGMVDPFAATEAGEAVKSLSVGVPEGVYTLGCAKHAVQSRK